MLACSPNQKVISSLPSGIEHVWNLFGQICAVPHGSYNVEPIVKFYTNYLKALQTRLPGLTFNVDQSSNILVRIPASQGFQHVPGICLQGHSDMVCVKAADSNHDFDKDPLALRVVEEDGKRWLMATDTTLGADNSIGVAIGLGLIEEIIRDDSFKHGPLEVLITANEEVGLVGAADLAPNSLASTYLINLDSEDYGEICISCAGGLRATFTTLFERVDAPHEVQCTLKLTRLSGGHSGCDIHLGRANSLKLMARLIRSIPGARLIEICGGTAHNAIPAACQAKIVCRIDMNATIIQNIWKRIYEPYRMTDPDAQLEVSIIPEKEWLRPLIHGDSDRILDLLIAIPHGPMRFSPAVPGFVETSLAPTVLEFKEKEEEKKDEKDKKDEKKEKEHDGSFSLLVSARSSIETELDGAYMVLQALARATSMTLSGPQSRYPGWPANPGSALLKETVVAYSKELGHEAIVNAVHAGLEAGLICEKHPQMDAVSIGPTVRNPHSPHEALDIDTVAPIYRITRDIVAAIAMKYK